MDFLVHRTVDVWVDLSVELRVPRATAEQWRPELLRILDDERRDRLLIASADGYANRLVRLALKARSIGRGRWVATFDGNNVDLVPAGDG